MRSDTAVLSRFVAPDGFGLAEYRWDVPDARGHVVLAHGMTFHCGRNEGVAEALTSAGLSVSGCDMRGHGRSAMRWRDLAGHGVLLDDLATYVASEVARASVPVFVMGDSLGGCLAATLAGAGRLPVRGLVTTAAAVQLPDDLAPWARRMARVLSTVAPGLGLAATDASMVTRDPEVGAALDADPLVPSRVPARLIAVALAAVEECEARVEGIDVPLLVVHGTADRVTDPAGARVLVERSASEDATLRLLDGWYHDVLHEPGRDRLLAEIVEWICARL